MMKWTPSFFRRPDGSFYEAAIHTTGGAWNSDLGLHQRAPTASGGGAVRRAAHALRPPHPLYPRRGAAPRDGQRRERASLRSRRWGSPGSFSRPLATGPGRATSMARGWARCSSMVSTSPTAGTTSTWRCWDSCGIRRSESARVTQSGYGIMESIIGGEWPEYGLTAESDRAVSLPLTTMTSSHATYQRARSRVLRRPVGGLPVAS